MHNLHFVVVTAESGEDACGVAQDLIEDFGSENNWRTICGAVSQDNEVYDAQDGRYRPNETTNTIAKINKVVSGWMESTGFGDNAKALLAKGKKIEDFDLQELFSLKCYAEHLYQVKSLKIHKKHQRLNGVKVSSKFNVLEDEFYSYSYDECGVTQHQFAVGEIWVVFVDMHS